MDNNEIQTKGAKCISYMLQKCQNIRYLNLGQNNLNNEAAANIAQGIESCVNVSFMKLSLEKNRRGHLDAQKIGYSLQKMQNLKELNLNTNEYGMKKGKGITSITDSLFHCQNLTKLSLDLEQKIKYQIQFDWRLRSQEYFQID
ncbi:hypothetical protein ABPG72_019785 [Tetrahymena utriculariae]